MNFQVHSIPINLQIKLVQIDLNQDKLWLIPAILSKEIILKGSNTKCSPQETHLPQKM